ncbi:RNA polymerase sigma-70 factor [Spirosoma daeguense]
MFINADSDKEDTWLAGLQAGDEQAFRAIYERFWPGLYSVAYNYTRDQATAEEMVQDLFTTLWLKRHQLTIQSSLKAYLFRAIRNHIYDHLDKQAVRHRVHEQLRLLGTEAIYTTDEIVAYTDLQTQLTQAVAQLPQPTQTIFKLSRFDYLPVVDIAQRLNLSPKAIEYHITRALKLLRLQLKDFLLFALLTIFR